MKFPSDEAGFKHAVNNLFLAIIPDSHARPEIDRLAHRSRAEHKLIGKPIGVDRYHVTLHGLGTVADITPELIAGIDKICKPIAARTSPFEMLVDRLSSINVYRPTWPLVLCGTEPNGELSDFRRQLGKALALRRNAINPHVTLLYDAKNISDRRVIPITWIVRELVLVRSLVGLGRHEHLARWPLMGGVAPTQAEFFTDI
jgi:2'-5' RNA ligase